MSKRITNATIINAIRIHFELQGKRLTNLDKLSRPKLNAIITKYNLNLDELIIQADEIKKEEEIETQKEKEKQQLIDIENKKKEAIKEKEEEDRWNTLSTEDKEKVKQYAYDNYVKYILENNKKSIALTDAMEKDFRQRGIDVTRTSNDIICVKGINVVGGYYTDNIQTKEEYLSHSKYGDKFIYHHYNNEKFIIELFEIEMIKQGWIKEEDGEYYKTIIIEKKIKRKDTTTNANANANLVEFKFGRLLGRLENNSEWDFETFIENVNYYKNDLDLDIEMVEKLCELYCSDIFVINYKNRKVVVVSDTIIGIVYYCETNKVVKTLDYDEYDEDEIMELI